MKMFEILNTVSMQEAEYFSEINNVLHIRLEGFGKISTIELGVNQKVDEAGKIKAIGG